MPPTVYIDLYKNLCNWSSCLPTLLADRSLLFLCFRQEEQDVQLWGHGAEPRLITQLLRRVYPCHGSVRQLCSISCLCLGSGSSLVMSVVIQTGIVQVFCP